MIERVAKAIAKVVLDDGDGRYGWDSFTEETVDGFYDQARAAIEAMREPTRRMKMTSQGVFMNPSKNYTFEGSDWDRIIDAALTKS